MLPPTFAQPSSSPVPPMRRPRDDPGAGASVSSGAGGAAAAAGVADPAGAAAEPAAAGGAAGTWAAGAVFPTGAAGSVGPGGAAGGAGAASRSESARAPDARDTPMTAPALTHAILAAKHAFIALRSPWFWPLFWPLDSCLPCQLTLQATALKSSAPVEGDSSGSVPEDRWNRETRARVFPAETEFIGVECWVFRCSVFGPVPNT